jgi:uncharacterized repeat protein (TIGR01451 family)
VTPTNPGGVTNTPTNTPTVTPTNPGGVTNTPTNTPTVTPTNPGGVTNTPTNTPTVTPTNPGGVTNTPSSTPTITPTPTTTPTPTGLVVAKVGSPNPVAVGADLTYTITVSNNGPLTAPVVMLTDTLPGSVTLESATPSQGTCNQAGAVVTCNLGPLINGGSATVTIIVTVNSPGVLVNVASVSPGSSTAIATVIAGSGSGIPTLSQPGLLALTLLLAGAGLLLLLRKGAL